MSFTSPIFLFLFLPLSIIVYRLFPKAFKNFYLFAISLLFYAWTQWFALVPIMLAVIGNWGLTRCFAIKYARRPMFYLGIVFNVGLLVFYKYYSDSFPLGLSFFTFHSLSYLIDSYRGESEPCSPLTTGIYLLFFPHVSAGPLTRARDFTSQLHNHPTSIALTNGGIERIIVGLSQKLLLANTFAVVVDQIFAVPSGGLTFSLAWVGIIMYTMQIYFDFAGYSNIAIGLGNLFGFVLPENFNLPYIATSVNDFWSRWHISLTSWLRQYIYFPLGGSREGYFRTYLNILIVFIVSGLWHGNTWNFVLWGLWYAIFMILEKWGSNHHFRLPAVSRFFGWVYTLLVVMLGWVLFRATTLSQALSYTKSLLSLSHGTAYIYWQSFFSPYVVLATIVGLALSLGLFRRLRIPMFLRFMGLSLLLGLSLLAVAGNTYSSFIYFHF